MRISVLGFRTDLRIELQAPVVILINFGSATNMTKTLAYFTDSTVYQVVMLHCFLLKDSEKVYYDPNIPAV